MSTYYYKGVLILLLFFKLYLSSADELEKETKKLKITEKKQDKLLYVCFHVLLNMAEDIQVKKKEK